MHLTRIAPSPYYKPPILAYTKQTLSSVTTVSTRRLTRGQTAPSVSSLNDNTTIPLHRVHPDIPPTIESTPITHSTPSTSSSLTPSLTPSSTHQLDPGSPPGLATPPATQSTAITPSTPSTPSSLAPSSPHQSDPGTPPGLVSCSDSDSDSDSDQSFYNTHTSRLSTNMSQNNRMSLLNTKTTARFSVEPGKLPTITPGELTPDLLTDFKNGCYAYFAWKDVPDDKQVMKIAWGLQDARVQIWYRTNCAVVNAAGFAAFMSSVKTRWLPAGWEHSVRCLILSSLQQNLPVADWIHLLESTNAMLASTTSHLSDDLIHAHIETHLNADTQIAAHLAEAHLITNYAAYVCAIKLIDDNRIRQAMLLQDAVTHMYVGNPSFRRDKTTQTPATNTTGSSTLSATPANCLPPLTAFERTLLQNNEGCFKCHVPFAEHLSCDCPMGFPDKSLYKPLTEADIAIAKRRKGVSKPTKAAAVLPVTVTPAVVIMPSATLGNGSDSECVDTPFSSPHFFVDVIVSGSSCLIQCPVRALIDHGCDAVLISPEFADQLGLSRCNLPEPKSVVVTIEGDQRKEIVFQEFVRMTVISSDQTWSSHSCRAIIAPNLCSPLILGNAFLAYNHSVIDHELRTCIDKKTGYDLINSTKIRRTIIKLKPRFGPELRTKQKNVITDIKSLFPRTCQTLNKAAEMHTPCPITVVRDRIESSVTQEQLRLKDAEFKACYLDLFPPDVPDVAELPDDILMNIKLRDELKPMVAKAYSCPRKY